MLQCKDLKFKPKSKRSRLYLWWIQTSMSDYYYGLIYKMKWPFKTLKKLYDWQVNVFKEDYDFDGHSMFGIIEYKLKRLQHCMVNGNSVLEPKEMKALALAIKLAGRLKEDKYDTVAYRRIDERYGESKSHFEPIPGRPGYSTWHHTRPKVNTEEEKREEREWSSVQYTLANNKMKREEKLLYAILNKYMRHWWD